MAIDWRNEPVIDSVQLPGGETKYWVQDTEAREKIETLANATHFIGVSTTEITDGGTEKPTINEKEVNPVAGDIVIWKPLTGAPLEFIWDGSKWDLLGGQAIEGLGDLAYKDSASGSYKPEGSIDVNYYEWTNVVTGISDSSVTVTGVISSEPSSEFELSSTTLTFSENISRSSISYFGSSRALNYINLASQDDEGQSYDKIITDINLHSLAAVTSFNSGNLPTIDNQSTITVAMGTGSSSTTLIFNLSDIGFDPGTEPEVGYNTVYGHSSQVDYSIKYASVSFLTLNPNTANIVTDVSGTVPLYYSIAYTGGLEIETGIVPSSVTATFSGTSSTITVS